MDTVQVILSALNQMVEQLVAVLPKLIIALIIWYLGKHLLGLAVALIRKVDVKKNKVDNKAVAAISSILEVVGRIILILVILDYLGIGRTIIAAVAQGVTFAIAIALGISFGKALEGDAKHMVENIRKFVRP